MGIARLQGSPNCPSVILFGPSSTCLSSPEKIYNKKNVIFKVLTHKFFIDNASKIQKV